MLDTVVGIKISFGLRIINQNNSLVLPTNLLIPELQEPGNFFHIFVWIIDYNYEEISVLPIINY